MAVVNRIITNITFLMVYVFVGIMNLGLTMANIAKNRRHTRSIENTILGDTVAMLEYGTLP